MISKSFFGAMVVCAVLTWTGRSQAADAPEYTALEAAKHIGETATVTDKVDDAYQAKGGNIFLNMGGKHPNEAFTVFIPTSAASEFKDVKIYDGKTISVTGKIAEHGGKPQIIVKSSADITSKVDDLTGATSSTAAAPSAPSATPVIDPKGTPIPKPTP
jgi:hypothetical protein